MTNLNRVQTFYPVPDLPHGCGSWVVVRKGTLESVLELFDRDIARLVDGDRFDVLTAIDYLGQFNASVAQ